MTGRTLVTALLVITLAGCSGSDQTGQLAVRFSTPGQFSASGTTGALATGDTLILTGTNGTLRIDDIRLVVADFELKAVGDTVPEEVHARLSTVDLPLDGSAVALATGTLPAGTYDEAEFKVDNLSEDGEDDANRQQEIQAALAAIRQDYPAFPNNASVVIHGTFTPAGGQAQPFTTYLNAEIEVEMHLAPPVTIPGTDWMTVQIDPALWFKDGTVVMNLAAFNGTVIEFEAEMEHGFSSVEHD